MAYKLVFTESYLKRAKKFAKLHPEVRQLYQKILLLLEQNPFHPSLRLHALSGRLSGLHSVSINLSYRLTIELLIDDEKIIFINVGGHDDIYR
ncbi:MAG TPA: type II toxin-antitoxin system mRNA interferase toxin, RelE/StbE family [Methylophaga sp.]|nr:type II toxin-antitoxin system mRNA interferase toxin, RelE/StbE family [Methylophaga sp.]